MTSSSLPIWPLGHIGSRVGHRVETGGEQPAASTPLSTPADLRPTSGRGGPFGMGLGRDWRAMIMELGPGILGE